MRIPDKPSEAGALRGPISLRYEDVCQDGRLTLVSLPHAFGELVWPAFVRELGNRLAAAQPGVLPILTRQVFEGGEGPISVLAPLTGHGAYQLAHVPDAEGNVERLLVNMWIDLYGVRGNTHGMEVEDQGREILVGRLFSEHVVTRLFAPPEERKVRALILDGQPLAVPARCEWRAPDRVAALPPGAEPLGPLAPDSNPICFGLGHTDSNQHVNSLVYPRLFEDAALRRLATHGIETGRLARRAEIAFRKPFFAGERAALFVHTFKWRGHHGAAGFFTAPDAGAGQPAHCYWQVLFD